MSEIVINTMARNNLSIFLGVAFFFANASLGSEPPMSIVAGAYGGLDQSESWHVTISPSGHAEITIGFGDSTETKSFEVDDHQLKEFRRLLSDSDFFRIAKSFGGHAPDVEERTVLVAVGPRVGLAVFRNFDSISSIETIREARSCLSVRHAVQRMLKELAGIDDAREFELISLNLVEKRVVAGDDSKDCGDATTKETCCK